MVNMSICYGYYSFKSLHLSILARPVYIPYPQTPFILLPWEG